ncbi:heavy metal-binding domain-containing protein [Rhodobacteraceae bacterium RKSG542]|uniref:heavy metal-binding domain-containing protein n=1 Tax=Pseudovibrio flavus TaxID=2529854 RepID=UPI0012BCC9E6|nr:heavy metal-binding domain-containing protein [Pseudovibrio flavus]MTI18918.1 heavy metal-binding domain-containing protein [Pseudovibrio flavus]
MLTSTTHTLQGLDIVEYKGLVHGEAIMGANIFKDLFAGIRDIVGGRSGAYEAEIEKARRIAIQEMCEQAQRMGANGVIGIDVDYETVGSNGSMMMVTASGTAIVYR